MTWHWSGHEAVGWLGGLVLVAACGTATESVDTASVSESALTTVPSALVSREPAVTSTMVEGLAVYEWPELGGLPPWTSVPLGIPGTTHVRVTHGPLGFLSINNVSRGAVVRISVDATTWQETAILHGPGGEEQVEVRDLLVTEREYLLVGETWTNTTTGSESFKDVLWRSPDAVTWDAFVLDRLDPGAKATALAMASSGLVLAGAVYDSEIGAASPRLWLEQPEGGFVELTGSISSVEQSGWMEGVVADGDGLLAWGSTGDDRAFVWRTSDFQMWSRGVIDQGRVRSVGPGGFATDAVSEGFAGFGRAHRQGEYAVALATVGYRSGLAWCYEDPDDCLGSVSTVLVTPNGRDWRRLPFPGAHEQPEHPVEAHGFLVDGRLAVVHTMGEDAVLSILESVENAVPLSTGDAPHLAFMVASPGDQIESGIRYGYPVWTHCGLPAIGPLNGVYWVIARYVSDPDDEPTGCM